MEILTAHVSMVPKLRHVLSVLLDTIENTDKGHFCLVSLAHKHR